MPVGRIDHYAIRTADVDKSCRFYIDVLGMRIGPRPPFTFPGAWLYAEEQDDSSNGTIHLVEVDAADPAALSDYLGERDAAQLNGSGAVDHIAFLATGLDQMRRRLSALGIKYRERTVPLLHLHQVFVVDPSGVTLELNYPCTELDSGAEEISSEVADRME